MSATANNLLTPAGGRRGMKAARRDVLVQCDRCSCVGTGRLNGFGKLVSSNVPAVVGRTLRHRDCGGTLACFDIAEQR